MGPAPRYKSQVSKDTNSKDEDKSNTKFSNNDNATPIRKSSRLSKSPVKFKDYIVDKISGITSNVQGDSGSNDNDNDYNNDVFNQEVDDSDYTESNYCTNDTTNSNIITNTIN